MNKTTLIAIILGVLVVVSLVQAVQMSSLKAKIAEGKLSVKSAGGSVAVSAGSGNKVAAVPDSVKNLPQMVGGC